MVRHVNWEESHYPDLYMPYSPCISMQWCYRDGRLVNLPWSFLVPGDVIVLIPAQKIISKCYLVNVSVTGLRNSVFLALHPTYSAEYLTSMHVTCLRFLHAINGIRSDVGLHHEAP